MNGYLTFQNELIFFCNRKKLQWKFPTTITGQELFSNSVLFSYFRLVPSQKCQHLSLDSCSRILPHAPISFWEMITKLFEQGDLRWAWTNRITKGWINLLLFEGLKRKKNAVAQSPIQIQYFFFFLVNLKIGANKFLRVCTWLL